jgi:hypothetical protein
MITATLVHGLVPSLSRPFTQVLEKVDHLSISPALALREPLAKVAVSNPRFLQRNFSRHSIGELATSMTLDGIAAKLKPGELRDQMVIHAKDELRHSKMFRALADGLGRVTGTTEYANYDAIIENDQRFLRNYTGDVISFVCDLFAGEVRTYSFVSGYVKALSQESGGYGDKAGRVLAQVLEDECRHVNYTASYLSRWMDEGLPLSDSITRSFKQFDQNSWLDVAETAEFFAKRE